jgi:hypothetical protein
MGTLIYSLANHRSITFFQPSLAIWAFLTAAVGVRNFLAPAFVAIALPLLNYIVLAHGVLLLWYANPKKAINEPSGLRLFFVKI